VLFFEKGAPTKKVWFYQLNLDRNLGKTNSLNEADLADFVALQKTKADSANSWSLEVTDIDQTTFDLSVKNPNRNDEAQHRNSQDIMAEIVALDAKSASIINNTREVFESALQSVFTKNGNGWQTKKLGDVCEVVNGGTPKTSVNEYWGGDLLWITPAEMGKRSSPYVSETERRITDKGLKNSSAKLLPPKSVILSTRAPIGHLVINTEPMATNQGCKGLIPSAILHYKYLFYYLGSKVELLNDLGSGATFKELSGGKLKEVTIPIAPLPEQQRIVAMLDELSTEIKKLETINQQKEVALEELKKSIINRSFSSQLH